MYLPFTAWLISLRTTLSSCIHADFGFNCSRLWSSVRSKLMLAGAPKEPNLEVPKGVWRVVRACTASPTAPPMGVKPQRWTCGAPTENKRWAPRFLDTLGDGVLHNGQGHKAQRKELNGQGNARESSVTSGARTPSLKWGPPQDPGPQGGPGKRNFARGARVRMRFV